MARKKKTNKRRTTKARGRGRPTNRPNRYLVRNSSRTIATSGSLTTARTDMDRAADWGQSGLRIVDTKTGEEWSY